MHPQTARREALHPTTLPFVRTCAIKIPTYGALRLQNGGGQSPRTPKPPPPAPKAPPPRLTVQLDPPDPAMTADSELRALRNAAAPLPAQRIGDTSGAELNRHIRCADVTTSGAAVGIEITSGNAAVAARIQTSLPARRSPWKQRRCRSRGARFGGSGKWWEVPGGPGDPEEP